MIRQAPQMADYNEERNAKQLQEQCELKATGTP